PIFHPAYAPWERSQRVEEGNEPMGESSISLTTSSRRNVLRAAAAGAGAFAIAGPAAVRPARSDAATAFYKGADISWAQQMEAHGYYWKNSSGVKQDIFTILKGYGISAIRLRTFVNPSSDPANGHCSISETAAMAVRAKDAGMAV